MDGRKEPRKGGRRCERIVLGAVVFVGRPVKTRVASIKTVGFAGRTSSCLDDCGSRLHGASGSDGGVEAVSSTKKFLASTKVEGHCPVHVGNETSG
jgi:hypothetical protein